MTAGLVIREAGPADVPALAAFARLTYTRAFGASFAPADLAHHLAHRLSDAYFAEALRGDTILLAFDGELIGFAQVGSGADGEQIRRLYVHPERHGRGLGTTLMRAVLTLPRLQNATRVYLDVWEKNEGARRLYERFGFCIVGTVPFVTPSGVVTGHDLLMMRPLR
ncbi:MAG: GNAT family N-acetyltransferase [Rhizomicrobium sp.]